MEQVKLRLEAEIAFLDRLLKEVPKENVIERLSLESRKETALGILKREESFIKMNRRRVEKELLDIRNNCGKKGWDGYDAKRISNVVCNRVQYILDKLPDELFEGLELCAVNDNSITLEWVYEREVVYLLHITRKTLTEDISDKYMFTHSRVKWFKDLILS